MGPSRSPEQLAHDELDALIDIADRALRLALAGGTAAPAPVDELPPALGSLRGAFVTLTVAGSLNGCIGTIDGREPLAHAVARLAVAAAFDDPRLPALRAHEYAQLSIEVSVLSPLEPVAASDRAELVAQLRPHVDGAVIRAGYRSGLFLPSVWEQLPDPDDFLDHLWRKAGLPPWVWPEVVERFTTQHRSRPAGRIASDAL